MGTATWMMALSAISLLLSIANTLWVWLSRGAIRAADHERRIQAIEGELKHLPSKEDVAALELQLSTMHGQLNSAERELASVARTARRIEDHLLGMKA